MESCMEPEEEETPEEVGGSSDLPQPPTNDTNPSKQAEVDTEQHEAPSDEPRSHESIFNDLTSIPKLLERTYDRVDPDAPLRPTIITTDDTWLKTSKPSLLSRTQNTSTLGLSEREAEKNKVYDLLDALTKSGVLMLERAELHIMVAATHCFDKTVIATVIEDSINPIERVEKSILIAAQTIQEQPLRALVQEHRLPSLQDVCH